MYTGREAVGEFVSLNDAVLFVLRTDHVTHFLDLTGVQLPHQEALYKATSVLSAAHSLAHSNKHQRECSISRTSLLREVLRPRRPSDDELSGMSIASLYSSTCEPPY